MFESFWRVSCAIGWPDFRRILHRLAWRDALQVLKTGCHVVERTLADCRWSKTDEPKQYKHSSHIQQ